MRARNAPYRLPQPVLRRWLSGPFVGLMLSVGIVLGISGARAAADDEKARLKDLVVTVEEDKVLISCKLVDAVDEKVWQRIESGLATGFGFDFKLVRFRKNWTNKEVESREVQVIVMYNALNREYLVNTKHDGALIASRVVRQDELEKALTHLENLELFSLEGVRPGELFVRARAELGTSSILFFIPTIRATDWIESERFELNLNGGPPPEPNEDGAEDEEEP